MNSVKMIVLSNTINNDYDYRVFFDLDDLDNAKHFYDHNRHYTLEIAWQHMRSEVIAGKIYQVNKPVWKTIPAPKQYSEQELSILAYMNN